MPLVLPIAERALSATDNLLMVIREAAPDFSREVLGLIAADAAGTVTL
ncbi:hypothetical protein [Roseovarius aestuarii]|nr:hypothetical protein [Roseovarius aestuarii]